MFVNFQMTFSTSNLSPKTHLQYLRLHQAGAIELCQQNFEDEAELDRSQTEGNGETIHITTRQMYFRTLITYKIHRQLIQATLIYIIIQMIVIIITHENDKHICLYSFDFEQNAYINFKSLNKVSLSKTYRKVEEILFLPSLQSCGRVVIGFLFSLGERRS